MTAPTLLVGLGGTGSKIVCKVSEMINAQQRRHIGIAVFDTDINELKEIHDKDPYIQTIQTSTRLTVGEYLNIDTHARETWFPENPILNSKTLTEGAGQVRAVSRLAFETALRAGNLEPLHQVIENLYKLEEERNDQALRVVIVSSLAGGTGSGLILPVALYIRNFLNVRFHQSANITRGFFILPEVFYSVIPGQIERNNLKCNAYATLRELDAFMMKGDGTLPERFEHSVKYEFPRPGSSNFEEYVIRPYDFCFLFDAQNTEGRKLNSFSQYLDHAATCIYSQSIGPMNKRSNSSEDNTIRELCAQRGRNRYAGAGCSLLTYPMDDVQDYVAIKWTTECISKTWQKFDRMYLEQLKAFRAMQEEGLGLAEPNEIDDYIKNVDLQRQERDPFATAIYNQCMEIDSTGKPMADHPNWENYLNALESYVVTEAPLSNQMEVDQRYSDANSSIDKLEEETGAKNIANALVSTYRKMCAYRDAVYRGCSETVSILAYSIFKTNSNIINDHSLEKYLKDSNGRFIHPNAVRYFLYQTLKCLQGEYAQRKFLLEKIDQFFTMFADTTFDDPATEDVRETVKDLPNRRLGIIERMKKVPDAFREIKEKYPNYMKKVAAYRENYLLTKVLEEGISYIESLCESFRIFYTSFDSKLDSLNHHCNLIVQKYSNEAGKTTRYVCASQTCLDKFVERVPYTGSAITLDSALAAKIYRKLRDYAMMKNKPSGSDYFSDIFYGDILGYFREKLMQRYGSEIDMDIIDALMREVEFEHDEPNLDRQIQYVKTIIQNVRRLSDPFIEHPMGEQRSPISACTFNPDIDPNDGSPRADLIATSLKNYGGIVDDDIPTTQIMFYQSIYGLRANQLSKFSPAIPGRQSEGEYFKAYFEIISQINPRTTQTRITTPHIDRNWHIIDNLPDLDDNNHKAIEKRIYSAFLFALLNHWIDYKSLVKNSKYLYKLTLNNENNEDLVVSNGTPCDNFYEVLDALMLNQDIVNDILTTAKRYIEREINSSRKAVFSTSRLKTSLDRLVLEEFQKGGDHTFYLKEVSLFDIVICLKISAPALLFTSDKACNILRTMFEVMYDYMSQMTSAEELNVEFGRFIQDQFYVLLQHAQDEKHPERKETRYDHAYSGFIGDLLRVVYDILEDHELSEIADEIMDQAMTYHWQ